MIDELSIKKSYEYIRRIKELNTGLIIELIVFLANIIVGFIVLAISCFCDTILILRNRDNNENEQN